MTVTRLGCCGIIEINGLYNAMGSGKDASQALRYALDEGLYTGIINKCGWVVFSQAYLAGREAIYIYGTAFRDYLESEGLGTVTQLPSTLNKNSGNMIDIFMWQVDHLALAKWKEAHMVEVAQPQPMPVPPAYESVVVFTSTLGNATMTSGATNSAP